MTERPRSAAASIYPNLPSGTPDIVEQRRVPGSTADAIYPHLRPPLPSRLPAPRRRLTREEAFDWSHVDPRFARLVGLVPKR